jgi:hypothetical protein
MIQQATGLSLPTPVHVPSGVVLADNFRYAGFTACQQSAYQSLIPIPQGDHGVITGGV